MFCFVCLLLSALRAHARAHHSLLNTNVAASLNLGCSGILLFALYSPWARGLLERMRERLCVGVRKGLLNGGDRVIVFLAFDA